MGGGVGSGVGSGVSAGASGGAGNGAMPDSGMGVSAGEGFGAGEAAGSAGMGDGEADRGAGVGWAHSTAVRHAKRKSRATWAQEKLQIDRGGPGNLNLGFCKRTVGRDLQIY